MFESLESLESNESPGKAWKSPGNVLQKPWKSQGKALNKLMC